jgi:DNA polymerase III subunit delta
VPTVLQPDQFLAHLASGTIAPVYFITGPDGEMKSRLITALCDTVEPDFRDFNVDRQHAAEGKPEQRKQLWNLLDLARTMPMMARRRVVVLQEAERTFATLRDEEAEAFEAYLKNPSPDACVAFVTAAKPDARTKVVKALTAHATTVDCDPLEDANDAAAWVKAAAASEGVRIESGAVRLLATLAGDDIERLRAEFERAVLFASGEGIITAAAVQEVVSAPTTKDPWALNNALRGPNVKAALRELALKLEAGEFPLMILGQIGAFVRRDLPMRPGISTARVQAAVEALMRTDLALKTSGGDPRVLLERLVVELCR